MRVALPTDGQNGNNDTLAARQKRPKDEENNYPRLKRTYTIGILRDIRRVFNDGLVVRSVNGSFSHLPIVSTSYNSMRRIMKL